MNIKKLFTALTVALILLGTTSLVYAVTILPTTQGGTGMGFPAGVPANVLIASGSSTSSPFVATTSPLVGTINASTTNATSTFAGNFFANIIGSSVSIYSPLFTSTSVTASSSFANGINITTTGCFALKGTCLATATSSGNGTVISSTAGQFAFYPATAAAVQGTSTLFINTTSGQISVGSTTPPAGSALLVAGYAQSCLQTVADGSTVTLDWNQCNTFAIPTLGGNRTIAFSNVKVGGNITLYITQGSGSNTLTWPATVAWKAGNAAPTLSTPAGATDVCWFGAATSTNTIQGSCR